MVHFQIKFSDIYIYIISDIWSNFRNTTISKSILYFNSIFIIFPALIIFISVSEHLPGSFSEFKTD